MSSLADIIPHSLTTVDRARGSINSLRHCEGPTRARVHQVAGDQDRAGDMAAAVVQHLSRGKGQSGTEARYSYCATGAGTEGPG